jgi:flagellar biosynthesis GTPase FlhF
LTFVSGNFELLTYIFKNHVTSVAERDRKDETGENLYQYLIRSHDIREGTAQEAFNILRSHRIKVKSWIVEQIQEFLENVEQEESTDEEEDSTDEEEESTYEEEESTDEEEESTDEHEEPSHDESNRPASTSLLKNDDVDVPIVRMHDVRDGNRSEVVDDESIVHVDFKELEWEIECTSEVWNILCAKTLDSKMKNRILKIIKMLGSGEFVDQPHLMMILKKVPSHIKLYEAKITKAARLIWEIDIAYSSRLNSSPIGKDVYTDVIRLWNIVLNHNHIHRSIQTVVKSHNRGKDCLLQTGLKGIQTEGARYKTNGVRRTPRTYIEDEGGLKQFVPPASSKDTEYHIMKFYAFDFVAEAIQQTPCAKIDFPFKPTELEHAIISMKQDPPCPLLLLGRSGTGKTTCCLYRLWSRYVNYCKCTLPEHPLMPKGFRHASGEGEVAEAKRTTSCIDHRGRWNHSSDSTHSDLGVSNNEGTDHLHQIFVTKNRILCTEIKKHFKCLCHGCPEAQLHVQIEDESLPNRLQLVDHFGYPLFLASKQFLVMLDASLPGPNFFPRNVDGSLKRKIVGYSEGDVDLAFIPDISDKKDKEEKAGKRDLDQRRQVTYEIFAYELWPKMITNQKVKVTCHPSLVWTEIISFIKGSIEALHSINGCLDPDAYNRVGRKRAPNFPGCREQVYQLFQVYSKLIKEKGLFDETDLIFHLYRRMEKLPSPEWYLHEIYVDETQDFTQAELALLIRCCHDPNNMFLTGDTAQSIMRGIAFRFSDLKSLFYYARVSHLKLGTAKPVEVPRKIFQLLHNYRSHTGILNLATRLLDLIDRFFPASYDRIGLEKDRGLFEGPKPVVIDSCSYNDLASILCDNKRDTSQIEFGAHQAILVVNDEAKNKLPKALRIGLVLTIYESKGLEFDDILLYNFFKDSEVNTALK